MPFIKSDDPLFSLTLHLVQAAKDNHLDLAQDLLTHGAPADGIVYERYNAMFYAAEHGNIGMGQALVDAGAVLYDPLMIKSEPALHRAITFGKSDFAHWVLRQNGMNPNQTNADGWTALHMASVAGDARLVEHLLARGTRWDLLTQRRDGPRHPNEVPSESNSSEDAPYTAMDLARAHSNIAVVAVLERAMLASNDALQQPADPTSPRPRL